MYSLLKTFKSAAFVGASARQLSVCAISSRAVGGAWGSHDPPDKIYVVATSAQAATAAATANAATAATTTTAATTATAATAAVSTSSSTSYQEAEPHSYTSRGHVRNASRLPQRMQYMQLRWQYNSSGQPTPAMGCRPCLLSPLIQGNLPADTQLYDMRYDMQYSRRGMSSLAEVVAAAEHAPGLLSAVKAPVSYPDLYMRMLEAAQSPGVLPALSALCLAQMQEFTAAELANVLWAFASVGHTQPALYEAVTEVVYGRLNHMGAHELAVTLWAFAVSGTYHCECFSAFTEFVWENLAHATPRQLAYVTASYATFDHYVDDMDLFDELAAHAQRQLEAFSPSDLALLLKSLAILRHPTTSTRTSPNPHNMSSVTNTQPPPAASTTSSSSTGGDDQAAPGSPPAARRGLFVDATRHVALNPKFIREASPADLADILYAAALVGHHDADLMEAAARQLLATARAEASQAAAASGASAQLGSRRSAGSSSGGSSSSRGSSSPGVAHPPCRAVVQAGGLLSTAPAHNPLLAPDSVPALSAKPQAGRRSESNAAPGHGVLDPENLSKVGWAYAVLGHWHGDLMELVFRQARNYTSSATALTDVQAARLFQVQLTVHELWPGLDPVPAPLALEPAAWCGRSLRLPLSMRLPDALLPQAFTAYQAQAAYQDSLHSFQSWKFRPDQGLTRSEMQDSMSQVLATLGYKPSATACTIDGTLSPRLAMSHKGLLLAVEPLDPSECMRTEPYEALGPVAARFRSLSFRGCCVLPVPFHEWVSLPQELAPRREYLRTRIEVLAESVANNTRR